jgi:hypothetical protein
LAGLDSASAGPPYPFPGRIHGSVDQDAVETHRCHLFIDPSCYARVMMRLGLDSPRNRLAMPRFFVNGKSGLNDEPRLSTSLSSQINEEERQTICSVPILPNQT